MFVVEVVDDAGQPVADGVSGWILVTDLMNRAMPLIRYCIGDVGFLNSNPCDCGRTSPRLTVQGRAHDVLVTGSGSWKTHDDVVDFCESFPGVDSCVVECRSSGKFNLTVIPGRQTAFEKDEFSKAFSQWIETNSRVSVRTASTIHAEAGGKFRFVRGNLNSMRGAA
jgi:phenylacetate-CoA ligase